MIRELIDRNEHQILCVLLPEGSQSEFDRGRMRRFFALSRYHRECRRTYCTPLRMTDSIKRLSERNDIPVRYVGELTPQLFSEDIISTESDLLLLAGGWPRKIQPLVYDSPKYGAINIHPSLLPNYRGTSVHRWQILNGEQISGVSIHRLGEEYDSGEMLISQKFELEPDELPQTLTKKAAVVAASIIHEGISLSAQPPNEPLNEISNSPAYALWKWSDDERFRINWEKPAKEIECFIRASTQESYRYIGPWTLLASNRWIIRKAREIKRDISEEADVGSLSLRDDGRVLVICGGNTALELLQIQSEKRNKRTGSGLHPQELFKIRKTSTLKFLSNPSFDC